MSQKFDPYSHGLAAAGHTDLHTPFLGPAPAPPKTSSYAKKATAKWNMPEAYVGESEYLRDTMEDWMLTANWTWYTERVMPWYRTDNIHFQWTEWENNPHYMGITPHQATSNVVTQRRTIRKASMIRRGIAAEFENDFIGTALGRTSFLASLAQMGRSVQETANVEVLRSLLGCHNYQHIYIRKHGIVKDGELDLWWQRRAERFMMAQKEEFGLEILSTQIEKEQEMYRAFSNCWIMGREVMDYCSTVPPAKTLYNLGGQEAVDRINGRPQNGQAAGGTMGNVRSLQAERWVAGIPVYLAKSYHVDSVGHADLLSRTTEIGVYNTMIDRNRTFDKYRTESRHIRVYDNDIDDWAEITLEEAIDKCIMWDENGNVADPFTMNPKHGSYDASEDDAANDFLRFKMDGSGKRNNLQYIGDYDMKWMTTHQAEQAGQTLYNAIVKNNETAAKAAEMPDATARGQRQATLPTYDGTTKNTTNPASDLYGTAGTATPAFKAFIETAASLLGDGHLAFTPDADKATESVPDPTAPDDRAKDRPYPYGSSQKLKKTTVVENLYKLFLFNQKIVVQPIVNISSSISGPSAADIEAKHGAFLRETIGSLVPASSVDQMNSVIGQTNLSWEERTAQLKDIILECQANDPQSVSALQSPERVKQWVTNRSKDYAQQLQQWIASQAPQQAQAPANFVPGITHIDIGDALPEGYTYANPADAQRTPTLNPCPSSLSQFTFLSHLFEQPEAAQQAGDRRGGIRSGTTRRIGVGAQPALRRVEPETLEQGRLRLLQRFNNLDKRIYAVANGGAPLIIKWCTILYLMAAFNRNVFLNFCSHHIKVPVDFLLIRAHCTYRTRYGIKCATGGKTGYTFFGHSNMQIEHEAARKVGMMHYTAYLSAVVMSPKNVYVVEDLFCEKYMGGMGVEFWKVEDYKKKQANRRLKSIVCTMLPPKMESKLEKKIDIRGRWYTDQAMGLVETDRFAKVCYPGAARTAMLMGWYDPIRKGRGIDKAHRARTVPINYVCFQAVQFHLNPKDFSWGDVIIEQGHMGEKVYPGCGRVRNGGSRFLVTPDYLGNVGSRR